MGRFFYTFLFLSSFLGCALTIFSMPVAAKKTQWVEADHVKARLVMEKDSIGPKTQTLRAALQIKLEPGWHSYWRTAGDAGLPPELDWKKSKNLKALNIEWPVPERFNEAGFYTYGYKDGLALPLTFTPKEKAAPLIVDMDVTLMVCKQICIPQNINFDLEIPSGDGAESDHRNIVSAAFKNIPHKGNLDDLKIENLAVGLDRLVVTATDNRGITKDSDIFVEAVNLSLSNPPVMEFDEDKLPARTVRFIIQADEDIENLSQALSGEKLILTLTNRGRSIEKSFNF